VRIRCISFGETFQSFKDGKMSPSEEPGVGISIDWGTEDS
jgi:hypothetical protein